jgi:hypothetical protein
VVVVVVAVVMVVIVEAAADRFAYADNFPDTDCLQSVKCAFVAVAFVGMIEHFGDGNSTSHVVATAVAGTAGFSVGKRAAIGC